MKPNILLVGGTNRNVGKTTLVCELIEHFSRISNVVGLKITNHYHLGKNSGFNLVEEHDIYKTKDSSRMLKAGASKVFYLESDANNLADAYNTFSEKISPQQAIICESNGLSKIVSPGVYLLVDSIMNTEMKPSSLEALAKIDARVNMMNGHFGSVLKHLRWEKGSWIWQK